MVKIKKELMVVHSQGLHARPAALFVQIASKYNAQVSVKKGSEVVNGKSIMGILMLGVQQNSKIIVEADGEDALELMAEIEGFLKNNECDHIKRSTRSPRHCLGICLFTRQTGH